MDPRKTRGVRLSDREIADLDLLRRMEPDMPGRGAMLRRLIERALADADKSQLRHLRAVRG